MPAERLLVETDAPYLSPQPIRGKPNQPANVARDRARAGGRAAGVRTTELDRGSSEAPPRGFRMVKLGQNFLVDRNILDVIERLAELSGRRCRARDRWRSGDPVRAARGEPAHVHVVEIDRSARARPARRARADFDERRAAHGRRARRSISRRSTRSPTKVVANLPYGIAATVLLRTIDELPRSLSWVVMVQREVGERLAAQPGTTAYGVPSVLAQLGCEVQVLRPIARNVFRPVPKVDSVLVGLRRDRAAPPTRSCRRSSTPRSPTGARRCAGSLALARGRDVREPRARARSSSSATRRTSGPSACHQRSSSSAGREARTMKLSTLAPGKVNLCLFLGRTPGGRPPRARDPVRVGVAGGRARADRGRGRAGADEVVCDGVERPEPGGARAERAPRPRLGGAAGPARDRQADPGRRRHGRRLGGRRGDAAARRQGVSGRPEEVATLAAPLGSDVPSQLVPACRSGPAPASSSSRSRRSTEHAFVIVPLPFALATADVYREADRLGRPRGPMICASTTPGSPRRSSPAAGSPTS